MAKILVTGGTGYIGKHLVSKLVDAGHAVVLVSRNPSGSESAPTFKWDPSLGEIAHEALDGVEVIFHLAGAGIADKPWTVKRKKEIVDSRVASARLILNECKAKNIKLRHFISASAIGWYPAVISDQIYDETSAPGTGFLAEVCKQWEAAADEFEAVADRVSKLRIGLVLGKDSTVLKKISTPVKYYLGAALGTGKQNMSWIHIDDVCNAFVHLMDHELEGVYNAVGPEFVTNNDFMRTLADAMSRPLMLPNIPEFLVRALFGDQADLVLKGPKISCKKIYSTGFRYEYPTVTSALSAIYF
ncbi:MAG: TIGR01777 family oxidoreductase [Salibacteraceae bacterium]